MKFLILVLLPFLSIPVQSQERGLIVVNSEGFMEEFNELSGDHDFLGVRILLQESMGFKLSHSQWLKVRQWLQDNVEVGWDTRLRWDRQKLYLVPGEKRRSLDRFLRKGDLLLQNKKASAAFLIFQKVARYMHKAGDHRRQSLNFLLYQSVIHSMARALYSANRFSESYEVYHWIDLTYPYYKQVLFERMWAAFRSGQIDRANGDVVAQYSSYFGEYIRPESLLVQIYIYRKLCRDQDLGLVLKKIRKFRKRLRNNEFNEMDWARSNFETRPIHWLIENGEEDSSDLISIQLRQREKARLVNWIEGKFNADKRVYLAELEKAMAYANMAIGTKSVELPPVKELPSPKELLEAKLEMWPVDDAEDWLDELGHHIFIGQSHCK